MLLVGAYEDPTCQQYPGSYPVYTSLDGGQTSGDGGPTQIASQAICPFLAFYAPAATENMGIDFRIAQASFKNHMLTGRSIKDANGRYNSWRSDQFVDTLYWDNGVKRWVSSSRPKLLVTVFRSGTIPPTVREIVFAEQIDKYSEKTYRYPATPVTSWLDGGGDGTAAAIVQGRIFVYMKCTL